MSAGQSSSARSAPANWQGERQGLQERLQRAQDDAARYHARANAAEVQISGLESDYYMKEKSRAVEDGGLTRERAIEVLCHVNETLDGFAHQIQKLVEDIPQEVTGEAQVINWPELLIDVGDFLNLNTNLSLFQSAILYVEQLKDNAESHAATSRSGLRTGSRTRSRTIVDTPVRHAVASRRSGPSQEAFDKQSESFWKVAKFAGQAADTIKRQDKDLTAPREHIGSVERAIQDLKDCSTDDGDDCRQLKEQLRVALSLKVYDRDGVLDAINRLKYSLEEQRADRGVVRESKNLRHRHRANQREASPNAEDPLLTRTELLAQLQTKRDQEEEALRDLIPFGGRDRKEYEYRIQELQARLAQQEADYHKQQNSFQDDINRRQAEINRLQQELIRIRADRGKSGQSSEYAGSPRASRGSKRGSSIGGSERAGSYERLRSQKRHRGPYTDNQEAPGVILDEEPIVMLNQKLAQVKEELEQAREELRQETAKRIVQDQIQEINDAIIKRHEKQAQMCHDRLRDNQSITLLFQGALINTKNLLQECKKHRYKDRAQGGSSSQSPRPSKSLSRPSSSQSSRHSHPDQGQPGASQDEIAAQNSLIAAEIVRDDLINQERQLRGNDEVVVEQRQRVKLQLENARQLVQSARDKMFWAQDESTKSQQGSRWQREDSRDLYLATPKQRGLGHPPHDQGSKLPEPSRDAPIPITREGQPHPHSPPLRSTKPRAKRPAFDHTTITPPPRFNVNVFSNKKPKTTEGATQGTESRNPFADERLGLVDDAIEDPNPFLSKKRNNIQQSENTKKAQKRSDSRDEVVGRAADYHDQPSPTSAFAQASKRRRSKPKPDRHVPSQRPSKDANAPPKGKKLIISKQAQQAKRAQPKARKSNDPGRRSYRPSPSPRTPPSPGNASHSEQSVEALGDDEIYDHNSPQQLSPLKTRGQRKMAGTPLEQSSVVKQAQRNNKAQQKAEEAGTPVPKSGRGILAAAIRLNDDDGDGNDNNDNNDGNDGDGDADEDEDRAGEGRPTKRKRLTESQLLAAGQAMFNRMYTRRSDKSRRYSTPPPGPARYWT